MKNLLGSFVVSALFFFQSSSAEAVPVKAPAKERIKCMNLSKTWSCIKKVTEKSLSVPPAECKSFKFGKNNLIDMDQIFGKKGKLGDECVIYNQFELKEDADLGFGAGADWWFEARLNGKEIYSTMHGGNIHGKISCTDHRFSGKGKKGKNILALHLKRGRATWTVAVNEVPSFTAPVFITADPSAVSGKIKIMNAVNNGPIKGRSDQTRGNMKLWKAAKIPFARNHDAAFCSSYGGEHTVDVHVIFPDFSKDPNDPESYDFTLTDIYLKNIQEGGTQVFYRLGSKIEHNAKKYGTKVPPDFKKWAVICEHIIRHFNEGWANGYHMNIKYWEIWNEPDITENEADKKTWQGTADQFFELYRITAMHLKTKFPKLKIGGPALAYNEEWMTRFLTAMTTGKRVPIDFFSWHIYAIEPKLIADHAVSKRKILDSFGYEKTESILDEWNYVRGWSEQFVYSIKTIIGQKGAAFAAGCMSAAQDSPVDMLMYYDARPCAFNGLFDYYTYAPLKTYYTFIAWSKLAELGKQFKTDTGNGAGIYATGAVSGEGRIGLMVTRYFEQDDLPGDVPVVIWVKGCDLRGAKLYLLDETHDLEDVPYRMNADGSIQITMKANTMIYLEK